MRKTLVALVLLAWGLPAAAAHAAELQGTVESDLDGSGVVYVLDAGERIVLHAGAARARQIGALDGADVILQGAFDASHRFVVDDTKPLIVKGTANGARALRLAVRESVKVHYTHGATAPTEGRSVWAVAKFEGRGFTLEVRHWADADALGKQASR